MARVKITRFSLRAFLVVTIALGSLAGYYVQRAQSQRRATKWVLDNGGAVYYDYQIDLTKLNQKRITTNGYTPPQWEKSDCEPPGLKVLRDLVGIDYFATVVSVYINDIQSPMRDLSQLKSLPQLEYLCIDFHNSDDCEFTAISSLSEIRRLEITAPLKDLSFVESLHQLQVIELFDTDIDDLREITNLKCLEQIQIESQVKNTGPLSYLTNLKSVSINTEDFNIQDFRNLKKLDFLELDVLDCRYSEAQLSELNLMLPTTAVFVRSNEIPYFESDYHPSSSW